MWRRYWRGWLVVMVGIMLAGCASPEGQLRWEIAPEIGEVEPAPVESELSYRSAMLVDELDAAVRVIVDLQYEAAAAKLEPLEPQFVGQRDRAHAAEALFWLGYCREKLAHPEEAQLTYQRVVTEYGDQPSARHARRRIERLKLDA